MFQATQTYTITVTDREAEVQTVRRKIDPYVSTCLRMGVTQEMMSLKSPEESGLHTKSNK